MNKDSKRKRNSKMEAEDSELEKKIEIISKLVEFATYSNIEITKETTETKSVISGGEESPIQYSKSNNRNEENRRYLTISALKKMKKPYLVFETAEGLSDDQMEEYFQQICENLKFSGIFKILNIESEQCLLAEIIGLKKKKYYIIIEKVLLDFIPGDFFFKRNLYFFQDLVIHYAKKERVFVFMVDQQTKSNFLQFFQFF